MRDVSRILLLTVAASGVLGTPQLANAAELNLSPDFGLVLMNVVVFTLLIYPTNRLLIQPLLRVIMDREDRSVGTSDRADQLRVDARDTQVELDVGIADMRGEAQSRRSAILAESDQKERGIIEDARERAAEAVEEVRRTIAMELTEARETLRSDTRQLAEEAATKILGRAL